MFRTAFGDKKRIRVQNDEPSMTKQSHKDECNINLIIKRHDSTGLLTHVRNMSPTYGEVTGDDFRDSMEKVIAAEQAFGELPSGLRKEFQNDPALFLDFVHDPENQDRMVELGLAEYTPEEKQKRAKKAEAKKEQKSDKAEGDLAPKSDKTSQE